VEGASPRSAARRDSPPQTEARESTIQVYEDVQMTPELMKCKVTIFEILIKYDANVSYRRLVLFPRLLRLV